MAPSFEEQLQNYADLVVRTGLRVRPGQRVLIQAQTDAAPFVRLIAERAYRAGSPLVDVVWDDDGLKLARFANAPRESFGLVSDARTAALNAAGERDDAVLRVAGGDPDLLAGQDPALVAQETLAYSRAIQPYRVRQMAARFNWCVVAAADPAWARRVFPDLAADRGVARLWELIFQAARADRPDPAAAWEELNATLARVRDRLNERRYHAVRFRGPGTNLTVGLADGHLWAGGSVQTRDGYTYNPNLPSEEVFTLPHRARVDGVVSGTKSLGYQGVLIDGIRVRFEGGRIVEATAAQGEEVLRNLLATDDGSARLGEVALVPASSPIARTGVHFHNTLYDENAASHIAVGRGYRITMEDGPELSAEAFAARGGNDSLVHVDWMIGSAEVDVDGLHADGREEPVMRAGEWAS